MKKYNRVFCFLLIGFMICSLFSNNVTIVMAEITTDEVIEDNTNEEITEEVTEAPTEAPTEEVTEAPTQEDTVEPTAEPSYEDLWDDTNQAYIISSVEDLKLFRDSIYNLVDYSKKTVYLLNDIKIEEGDDVGSVGIVAENSETSIFQGIFNGRGHCIEGWNKSDEALFMTIGDEGSISNLNMKNVNIENASPGVLYAFQNDGTISKCSASGSISGDANNYASFTYGNDGTISNCYSSCNISSTKSKTKIAGISYNNTGSITNCIYTGTLSTTQTSKTYLYGIASKSVSSNYYLYNESYTQKYGTSCTVEELKLQETYKEFDFANTWAMDAEVNDGYPYLQANFPDLSFVKQVPVTVEVSVGDYIYNDSSRLQACYYPLSAQVVYAGANEEIKEEFQTLISTYHVSAAIRTSNWKSDFLVDVPVNGVSKDFSSKSAGDYFDVSYISNEDYEFSVSGFTFADSVGTYYDDTSKNNCLTTEQKNQIIQKADTTVRTILNSIVGVYGSKCMENPFFDFTCARAGYYPSGTDKDKMFQSLSSMWKEYKEYQVSVGKSPETTETSKFVLAITALGYDATDVAGDNLITELYNSDTNGKYFAAHYMAYAVYSGRYGDYMSGAASLVKGQISSSKGSSYNADDMETMYAQPIFLMYNQNNTVAGMNSSEVDSYVENEIKPWIQRSITGFGNFYSTYTHCSANVWTDAQAQILIGLLNIDFLSEPYVKNGHTILDYIIANPNLSLGYSGDESQCARAIVALTRSYRGETNLFDCSDVTGVREVETMIANLPEEITEEDTETVANVQTFYNSLTTGQRNQVDNSNKLQNAVTTLKQIELDKQLAKEMDELIDSIGEVSLSSEEKITSVRNAYNNLTQVQKKRVTKYEILVEAEKTLAKLKAEEAKKAAEEEKNSKDTDTTNNSKNKTSSDASKKQNHSNSNTSSNSTSNTNNTTSNNKNSSTNRATNSVSKNTNTIANSSGNTAANTIKLDDSMTEDGIESEGTSKKTSAVTSMKKHINKLPKLKDGTLNSKKVTSAQVVKLYKEYMALSEEEQKAVSNYSLLEQAMQFIAGENQVDTSTGIMLEDAAWNLKLVVTPISLTSEEAGKLKAMVGENQVLVMYDIKLVDILTNTTCEPEDCVRVCIPSELVEEREAYTGLVIAHLTEAGKLEYIACLEEEGYLKFPTKSFSYFSVLGFKQNSPLYLNEEKQEVKEVRKIPIFVWSITGGAGLIAIMFILFLKRKEAIKKKQMKQGKEESQDEKKTI